MDPPILLFQSSPVLKHNRTSCKSISSPSTSACMLVYCSIVIGVYCFMSHCRTIGHCQPYNPLFRAGWGGCCGCCCCRDRWASYQLFQLWLMDKRNKVSHSSCTLPDGGRSDAEIQRREQETYSARRGSAVIHMRCVIV